jgi:transcriptional regulator with XRE-family HTH domain
MNKPFRTLLEGLPPERRKCIAVKTQMLKNEMALAELRQALQLTQEALANELQIKQAAVSKVEHQSDMYISTLRRILHAMGAELKITAHFPEGTVVINQFDELGSSTQR